MRGRVLFLSCSIMIVTGLGLCGQSSPPRTEWDQLGYHDFAGMTHILRGLARQFPGLARLRSIGKSVKRRDLWVLELTNLAAGKTDEKPGIYVQGTDEGDQIAGSELALYAAWYLLSNYGNDPRVTELLDTKTVYIGPRMNPDGSEVAFGKAPRIHSANLSPVDNDRDDLLDEDGPEDVNGDGAVTMMRVKDEGGDWLGDPKDSRLMTHRKYDERGQYRLYTEGFDNDNDGEINEDDVGGVNIDRNFPANYEMEYRTPEAGVFAVSEPETRAIVEFLVERTHVATILSFHMGENRPFRPRDTVLDAGDREIYDLIGKKYTDVTSSGIPGRDVTQPTGSFLEWSYTHLGAMALSSDLWHLPKSTDTPGPLQRASLPGCDLLLISGQPRYSFASAAGPSPPAPTRTSDTASQSETDRKWLEWNDRVLAGKGFKEWKPFTHPTIGEVEIGAWKPFTRDNPPTQFLPDISRKQLEFILFACSFTPSVKVKSVDAVRAADNLVRITASVTNQGLLPTSTAFAERNRLTRQVWVSLDLGTNAEMIVGVKRVGIGTLRAYESRTVEWLVRTKKNNTMSAVTIEVSSQGGGQEILIASPPCISTETHTAMRYRGGKSRSSLRITC